MRSEAWLQLTSWRNSARQENNLKKIAEAERSLHFILRIDQLISQIDPAIASLPYLGILLLSTMADNDIPTTPPSRSLSGKTAIVTGAGCYGDGIGNGRAISILLASDGANVLCVDRNIEWAEKTVSMIQEQANSNPIYGTAIAVQADVTSATDCEAVISKALSTFSRLDILINNVGIAGASGTAVTVDMDDWSRSLDVNLNSMVLMAKYAVPAMEKNQPDGDSGIRGSIVNMGSVAGLKGGTPHLLYPTAKGAVVNMTRAMAAHHAESGIRVNCVCPGV